MLTDRVAIITGGAGSLGQATARLFLKHGARVMLVDRDEAALAEAVAALASPDARSVTEVAQSVLFLASDIASFTTGATLTIDGGMMARARAAQQGGK